MGEMLVIANSNALVPDFARHAARAWKTVVVSPTDAGSGLPPPVGARIVDFAAAKDVHFLMKEIDPDVVVSALDVPRALAEEKPDIAHAAIAQPAERIAQASAEKGARLVVISSSSVFDGAKGGYAEEDPVGPSDAHGRAHAEAEEVSRRIVRNALVVRTAPILSRARHDPVWSAVRQALNGGSASLRADVRANYLRADEAGRLLVELVERAATGVYHLGSATRHTEHDLGASILAALGGDAARLAHKVGPGAPRDLSLDPAKAFRNIGENPKSVFEGIEAWVAAASPSA